MSKLKTLDVWDAIYGRTETITDYAGRVIKKSACGDPHSKYHPTIDHIRPLSLGGTDAFGNLVICHRDTNQEKADHFPHWKANGYSFKAVRRRGTRDEYDIVDGE